MMNYSLYWIRFYEEWLSAVSGKPTEGDLYRAREHADKCIKSLKESDSVH